MFGWFKKERLISKLNRLFKQKQYAQIVEITTSALEQNMSSIELYTFQIWSLLETKQIEKAKTSVDAGLLKYPNNPVLMVLAGEILYRLDQFTQAQEVLHKVLENSPGNLQVEYLLGLTYVAQGQLEEASEYFDSILRYDPTLLQTRLLAMAEHHAFLARKDR